MATHKATRTRPFVMSAAALASAAAIVGASPAFVSGESLALGGAPSPTKLVTANYELTALTDITVQGISDAYFFGWGGFIGANNPYYPNVYSQYGAQYVTGVSGVSYYLIDNILDTFTDFDLDNYYYEIGNLNGGNPNAGYSGAGAVIYVGTNELFGTDSPISQLTKTIFYYGTYPTVIGSVVSILQSVVPTFDIGPLAVGGGILATLYFYGATPDGSFNYGAPGLSALLAYVSTAITGLFPTAAATAAPAAAQLSAPDTSTGVASDAGLNAKTTSATSAATGVGGFKSESGARSAGAAEANAAETAAPEVAGGDTVAASADAAGTDAAGAGSAGTDETSAATSTGAADSGEASVGANAAAADSSDTGASAGTATSGKSGHASKRPNVVSQIAGKVRSALGGGKNSGDRSASSSEGSSQDGGSSSGN